MFTIPRYVSSVDKSLPDKDIILKNLKDEAAKRKGNLKRKRNLLDDSDLVSVTPEKCLKKQQNDTDNCYMQDKSSCGNQELNNQSVVEKYDENESSDDSEGQTNVQNETTISQEVLQAPYDPFAIFKNRVKSSNKLLASDLARAVSDGLPEWIKHPKYIEKDISDEKVSDDKKPFLSINQAVVENLKKSGVKQLFPVQTVVIPRILSGFEDVTMSMPNDICVCSPTGSGKTMAFAIPIIQYMLRFKPHDTRAVVIIPTIELAKQVHEIFVNLCKGCNVQFALLGNGLVENDIQLLSKKSRYGIPRCPEIIVSTPGRFAHLVEIPDLLSLKGLRFLVIDEADRILDLVKQSWLSKLKTKVPHWITSGRLTLNELCKPRKHVQKLLFSATLNPDPEKLKDLDLFQPRLFVPKPDLMNRKFFSTKTSKYAIPPTLAQHTITCTANNKPLIVVGLLSKLKVKKALCFTNSTESARRLHMVIKYYTEINVLTSPCLEFSSLLTKKARKRSMNEFTSKPNCILVSSDAAARGIDATDIEIVVIYDIPQYIEGYVHRAGRASRAGKTGSVYSLVTDDDTKSFKRLFKKAKLEMPKDFQINEDVISTLSDNYENALIYCQKICNVISGKQ